jgi:positive regulator of sigma E activity
MEKFGFLVAIIIAMVNLFYSFFGSKTTESILTIEMNIWVYRLIWTVASVLLIFAYRNQLKKEKNKQK